MNALAALLEFDALVEEFKEVDDVDLFISKARSLLVDSHMDAALDELLSK